MPSQRVLISALLAAVASAADSPAYAPSTTTCPSGGALVRSGNTQISDAETAYVAGRKPVADAALSTWLDSVSPGLGASSASLPTIGMSVSGGGWRSLLTAGGVLQALDGRDDEEDEEDEEEEGGLEERGLLSSLVSGLLQAVSYQVGVSGGAWLLASWAASNFATITEISESTWVEALDNGIARPGGTLGFISAFAEIVEQVNAKSDAGFPVSMTDVWSQLLSYQFLPSGEAGQSISLSDVRSYSNMTDFQAPIIILNANGVNTAAGECNSDLSSTVWEYTPFEFGSWDDDVASWIPMEYLGTSANSTECTVGFDNMGFVIGASSNLLAHGMCVEDDGEGEKDTIMSNLGGVIEGVVESALHGLSEATQFNRVPNPFKGYTSGDGSTTMRQEVWESDELHMVDGGLAHNDPVASLLEPARNVSVILLSDASADSEDNFPTGEGLIDAWELVQNNTRINFRMPTIPDQETFLVKGLNRRAVFFGCNEPEAVTIVYLPNVNHTYESNQPTSKYQYSPDETRGMIANGNAVATQNGDEGWGLCLACGILKKEAGATLPEGCDACFSQYCYDAGTTTTVTHTATPSASTATPSAATPSSVTPTVTPSSVTPSATPSGAPLPTTLSTATPTLTFTGSFANTTTTTSSFNTTTHA